MAESDEKPKHKTYPVVLEQETAELLDMVGEYHRPFSEIKGNPTMLVNALVLHGLKDILFNCYMANDLPSRLMDDEGGRLKWRASDSRKAWYKVVDKLREKSLASLPDVYRREYNQQDIEQTGGSHNLLDLFLDGDTSSVIDDLFDPGNPVETGGPMAVVMEYSSFLARMFKVGLYEEGRYTCEHILACPNCSQDPQRLEFLGKMVQFAMKMAQAGLIGVPEYQEFNRVVQEHLRSGPGCPGGHE